MSKELKQKQIEFEMAEMLEIIEKAREEYANDITDHTENEYIREGLLNAGYRKQSEVKKSKGCEYCKGRAYTKKPLTVITKYGRKIELVFEFCPNCGAKMKGGAE